MAKVDQDWGNIVFGVRGEQQTVTGAAVGAGGNLIRTTSEDTLYFPSAHANIDLNDILKLRVGVTTSASRPDFDDMRPNLTFNDVARTVSGGNPFAKPEKQTGIDVYLERYGEEGGFASVGFFYKDVSDVLFTQAGTFDSTVLNAITPAQDRSGYTLTALRNGGSGYLIGGELFFSQTAESLIERFQWPEWLGGFGLRGSATFTSSEVVVPAVGAAPDRRITLPGTSDSVYNVQLTYEMYGLSARLAYQQRSPWRQNVGTYTLVNGVLTPDGNGDTFWDEDDELDLSLRYRVSDNFEIYADGVNLLDGPGRRFADTTDKPIEYEKFGRRYIVGVRFNF
jgi:TonB-dependent receptor